MRLRLRFARELFWRPLVAGGASLIAILTTLQAVRGELPQSSQAWLTVATYLQNWPWHVWIVAILALLVLLLFEAAFRQWLVLHFQTTPAGVEARPVNNPNDGRRVEVQPGMAFTPERGVYRDPRVERRAEELFQENSLSAAGFKQALRQPFVEIAASELAAVDKHVRSPIDIAWRPWPDGLGLIVTNRTAHAMKGVSVAITSAQWWSDTVRDWVTVGDPGVFEPSVMRSTDELYTDHPVEFPAFFREQAYLWFEGKDQRRHQVRTIGRWRVVVQVSVNGEQAACEALVFQWRQLGQPPIPDDRVV